MDGSWSMVENEVDSKVQLSHCFHLSLMIAEPRLTENLQPAPHTPVQKCKVDPQALQIINMNVCLDPG